MMAAKGERHERRYRRSARKIIASLKATYPELDAQTLAWLDQEDRRTTEMVRAHGWAVEYVFGEAKSPSFAYTIGLFGLGHPELIVFGLDSASAGRILNTLGHRVRENRDLRAGEIVALVGPSGSGKTLTLPCIAGLITPDAGRIAAAGRTVLLGVLLPHVRGPRVGEQVP